MKRIFTALLIFLPYLNSFSQFENAEIVDLTHPFDSLTIFWPTEKGFQFEQGFKGYTENGFFYNANRFCTAEHGGTHLDAPIHFYKDRMTAEELPLTKLIGNAVVIDVSAKCAADRDYRVLLSDFEEWENKNGRINENSIVLIKTGFGKYWPDRKKYMGTDERGADAIEKLHFPGLHPEAAEWLISERNIKAVGIESPSIDYGQSKLFETHVILAKNNIPIFENVANLDKLPEKDFLVIALPMKIKDGSGAPLRIIAIIN